VIRDMLVKYVSRGSTVFLTSHVLEIVERLCTHVGIIVEGKLVEQGALEDLRHGRSLEDRFLETVGSTDEMHQELSWLGGSNGAEAANGEALADPDHSLQDQEAADG
jgi:ABC-2 type transport system ATP-binding protein